MRGEVVEAVFGGGGQVKPGDGEVGESGQGAPPAGFPPGIFASLTSSSAGLLVKEIVVSFPRCAGGAD